MQCHPVQRYIITFALEVKIHSLQRKHCIVKAVRQHQMTIAQMDSPRLTHSGLISTENFFQDLSSITTKMQQTVTKAKPSLRLFYISIRLNQSIKPILITASSPTLERPPGAFIPMTHNTCSMNAQIKHSSQSKIEEDRNKRKLFASLAGI